MLIYIYNKVAFCEQQKAAQKTPGISGSWKLVKSGENHIILWHLRNSPMSSTLKDLLQVFSPKTSMTP